MLSPDSLSPVVLGTMQFLWTTSEKEAYRILDTYYELGGTVIDTADMYPNWVDGCQGGEAEVIVGKWLKRRKNRDKIFLSTKVRARMWEGSDGEGLSRAHISKAIDESLKRLGTEYVDLYLSHWPDLDTPHEETLSTYQLLIKQGKVRFIGCSNFPAATLKEALLTGKNIGAGYSFIQAYYNLIDRSSFEQHLLPVVEEFDLSVMIYGPLAGGFLTGVYREGKDLPDHSRAEFIKDKMTPENMKLLDQIEKLAKKKNASIAQISLAWLLSKGYQPIIGADSVEQVTENMGAVAVSLTHKELHKLDALAISQ